MTIRPHKLAAALAVLLFLLLPINVAHAFCGFYVSGADGKLFNDATQVVLMRDGTRTALSMQNDYKGPPKDFALVIPVPVVLQKENVKTLSPDVFKRVDALSAPRLVEYWEQDPCTPDIGLSGGLGTIGNASGISGFGSGAGRLDSGVKIEAQFEVGEYEIVILSAEDSAGLYQWLKDNKYKIPDTAEPALRPYVAAGSKFFVAKVNVTKVKFDPNGRASLSPLRFHYDSDRFDLPVKLGLLNSAGAQDLIVNILASERYEVANYPNVTIPTNLDVTDATRSQFATFYASLFDRTLEKNKGAVVTEYSWSASKCDPCPGGVSGLGGSDVAALGADVMPNMTVTGRATNVTVRAGDVKVTGGKLPAEVVNRIVRQNFGRFRLCYENGLQSKPTLQGKVQVKFDISEKGAVENAQDSGSDLANAAVISCITRGFSNLSFPEPEDKKKVTVTYPILLSSNGSSFAVRSNNGGGLTLTRLHARYTKDTLGSDLIFRSAPIIAGGREAWVSADKIEAGASVVSGGTGAAAFAGNSFQGRYAIRHKWAGAIACKNPRRGIWGAPPNGVKPPGPVPATRVAYAPRGVSLASFTSLAAPGIDAVLASAATDPALLAAAPPAAVADAGSPSSSSSSDAGDQNSSGPPSNDGGWSTTRNPPAVPPASHCGCRVIPATRDAAPTLFGLVCAIGLLRRRLASNKRQG